MEANASTAPPAGAEVLTQYVLHLEGGRLVVDVVRLHDGTTRMRLSRGGAAGAILSVEAVGALRRILALALEAMCAGERRAA